MAMIKSGLGVAGLVAASALVFGSAARADDELPKFSLSATGAGTSDYVFRGVSQTDNEPAFQASIDATYGIFYAGVWGSNVDFADAPPANAEIDLYAGVKPVWGPATFDFGVIYYYYPSAGEIPNFLGGDLTQLDYVELKAGYSYAVPFIKGLTTGTTFYWSPDYSFESGDVYTIESTAAYVLATFAGFTPTISGTYGHQYGDSDDGYSVGGTAEDDFAYWNAGVAFAIEKFTFDFRYWDSDIDVVGAGGTVCVFQNACDERFVFTAKITLP